MKIFEQYKCPECFQLFDDKSDAQSCCVPTVRSLFLVDGQPCSDEAEAREHIYLKALQDGKPPLEAEEYSKAVEVVYAS